MVNVNKLRSICMQVKKTFKNISLRNDHQRQPSEKKKPQPKG